MSSFLLWFNHCLLDKGEAYQNYAVRFYPTNQIYSNLYTYAAPFNQLVSDLSISGAQISTGIYINSSYYNVGQEGFHGIDWEHGRAYFTSPLAAGTIVSGNVAFKEINVVLTNEPENAILFDTKYSLRPKVTQVPTGLSTNQITYPVVFIKQVGGQNLPYAFGGEDN